MRLPPPEVLASWPAPNYDDPHTQGPASVIVNVIFITLVVVTVGLRMYCRAFVRRWFGLDDVMILLAMVFAIGLAVTVILANERFGWDRHVWDLPTPWIEDASIIAMAAKGIFVLTSTFTRLSLCTFYYRLVNDSGIVWFKWVVHANVAFTVANCIGLVFLDIFICTPVAYYWQFPPQTDGHCLDEGLATIAAGVTNLVADIGVTITPLPLVMRLRMPLRERLGVVFVFGLGLVVIVAGVVRTYYIWKGLIDSYDVTWYAYPLWIAAAVEIDVAIICACAPALKSLLFPSSPRRPFTPQGVSDPSSQSSGKRNRSFMLRAFAKVGWYNPLSMPLWSGSSRSRKDSIMLPEPEHALKDTWIELTKSQTEVTCEPSHQHPGSGDRQALQIMRRDSVDLESLRPASLGSTPSHRRPSLAPEEHHVGQTTYYHVRRM